MVVQKYVFFFIHHYLLEHYKLLQFSILRAVYGKKCNIINFPNQKGKMQ